MIKRLYAASVFLFVMISMIALLYLYPRYKYASNSIAACLMSPVLTLQHIVVTPIKQYYQQTDIAAMRHRISDLEGERDQLHSELVALQASRVFAQETHELIRYKKRYSMNRHILTHIVLRYLNDHEQSMIVDCGSKHGVEKDMVAVYKNALVGKVTHVYPYTSKIVLITDPQCKVAIFCAQTKSSGIAEGLCNQKYFSVTHINHFDHLKKGEYVISSGAGLVFPKGFGLGTIQDFTSDGLFYTVIAKPLVELDRITHCYLIKKGIDA